MEKQYIYQESNGVLESIEPDGWTEYIGTFGSLAHARLWTGENAVITVYQ